jgi:DNA-binding CsgD family transcriptional regulator
MKQFNIEFFSSPDGEVLIKQDGSVIRELTEKETDLIDYIFEKIRADYTEAFKLLSKTYDKSERNFPYFKYLCVRRFIKCNFGNFDTLSFDVDDSMFHVERINCPLCGECPGYKVICQPKFNTSLSDRERRIMELYCEPRNIDDISCFLCLSPHTVETHLKNIRHKLGLHSQAEMMKFWENNMKL